jgi:hypothetical protein
MVDVTVDAKPMAKPPIDPDVNIPEAVRKRAAAVNALYNTPPNSNGNGAGASSGDAAPAQAEPLAAPEAPAPQPPASEATTPPSVSQPAAADQAPAPEPQPHERDVNWEHRYLAMKGRYDASQKTIGEMQEQMTQLGNELLQVQQAVTRPRQPPPPPKSYLTQEDVQNYGTELVDFTRRAAADALAPTLQQIEQQNAQLQRRLAEEARKRLDAEVARAVPNYREIDDDPRWRQWLTNPDVLTRRRRQEFLNEAIAAADAPRVISFFNKFLQEEQATGHIEPAPYSQQAAPPREPAIPLSSLAAPGRARPASGGDASLPPDKPIYSRAQVAKLYSDHRKGAYVGREAEWSRQDADIIAAGREGRIR